MDWICVHAKGVQPELPGGRIEELGSNLKGVLPKSRFFQKNSTQTSSDLVKHCSHHDGTTEERAAAL